MLQDLQWDGCRKETDYYEKSYGSRRNSNFRDTQVDIEDNSWSVEVGLNNVDTILESFKEEGIEAEDCSFWGDEFVGIQEGLYGSDSFMLTPKTEEGDFFDVSSLEGVRPEKIQILGGGVDRFIQFLVNQGK